MLNDSINDFINELDSIDKKQFKLIKKSTKISYKNSFNYLKTFESFIYNEIFNNMYDFNRRTLVNKEIMNIKLSEFKSFVNNAFSDKRS